MPHIEVHVVEARGIVIPLRGRYFVKLGWPRAAHPATTFCARTGETQPKWDQAFIMPCNVTRGLLVRIFVKRPLRTLCVGAPCLRRQAFCSCAG